MRLLVLLEEFGVFLKAYIKKIINACHDVIPNNKCLPFVGCKYSSLSLWFVREGMIQSGLRPSFGFYVLKLNTCLELKNALGNTDESLDCVDCLMLFFRLIIHVREERLGIHKMG